MSLIAVRPLVTPAFEVTQDQDWLAGSSGPIVVIFVIGVSRAGKSDFASRVARRIANRSPGDVSSIPGFPAALQHDPVTRGAQAILVPHSSRRKYLIVDCEGTENQEQLVARALMIAGKVANIIVAMESHNLNEHVIGTVARCFGLSYGIDPATGIKASHLAFVINQGVAVGPEDAATEALENQLLATTTVANTADRAIIRLAFPSRSFFILPFCSEQERNTVSTSYGVELQRFVNSMLNIDVGARAYSDGRSVISSLNEIIETIAGHVPLDEMTEHEAAVMEVLNRLIINLQERCRAALPHGRLNGRLTDDQIVNAFDSLRSQLLEEFDNSTSRLNAESVADEPRLTLTEWFDRERHYQLLQNQAQRNVDSMQWSEPQEELTGEEQHVMGEQHERDVWFHTDVDVQVDVYRIKVAKRRLITTLRNGDCTYGDWVEFGRSAAITRSYNISYSKLSTAGHIVGGVVTAAAALGSVLLTAGTSTPAVIAAAASALAAGIPAGIEGYVKVGVTLPLDTPKPPSSADIPGTLSMPLDEHKAPDAQPPAISSSPNAGTHPSSSAAPSDPGSSALTFRFDINSVGTLSRLGETGNAVGNPGTISSGQGDHGGRSYGIYQFASRYQVPEEFLQWLRTSNQRQHSNANLYTPFNGIELYSNRFDDVWRSVSTEHTEQFRLAQHEFFVRRYFLPVFPRVSQVLPGLDWSNASPVFHDVLFSTIVQHGQAGTVSILREYRNHLAEGTSLNERNVINGIYNERLRLDPNGNLVHFHRSSRALHPGIVRRLEVERQRALEMLAVPRQP